nr:CRTAC1 family protein [Thermoflexibacter sp.]
MKNKRLSNIVFFLILSLLFACNQSDIKNDVKTSDNTTMEAPLFKLLPASQTGIDFANIVKEDTTFNILNYLYFYNGGGVSVGDINNDGLPDIYFTANRLPNKLFLNKGNLKFEDITEKAGVAGIIGWTTGTTMADVNGDGWLDIYVCNVSNLLKLKAHNQLFINNQDGTFSEKSAEFGLNFSGFATQAAFFDYDKDGDLDCYLLNHSTHYEGTYVPAAEIRPEKNERAGDKLMKNEKGKFIDVSEKAGIYSSAVGYGLGITIGDINQDGWQDIYIANDFHENDYIYLNNGNGTFTESIRQVVGHTSKFSMGVDMADFNNDGRLDVFSADMMPEIEQIRKESEESADAYSIYQFKYSFGYYHQFAKNALQLNLPISSKNANNFPKNSTQKPSPAQDKVNFRLFEIAQLAGVATTDWSWSVLFADLDGDGWKDLFVANGIPRRPNDMDYLKFVSEPNVRYPLLQGIDEAKLKYTEKMPIIKVPNYAFKNNKNLTFNNLSKNWGVDKAGFSNGSAYADLDNDGDLDLIVNNFNETASIYENQNTDKNNYLKIKLLGNDKNTSGIGAHLTLKLKDNIIYHEQSPTRGFQSSVDHTLTIGVGQHEIIDSLLITWNNGKSQLLTNVKTNQLLLLKQSEALDKNSPKLYPCVSCDSPQLFQDITNQINSPFKHEENSISDFEREFLIPYSLSTQGSKIAKGDINGDGLEDLFVPNSKWKASSLLIQQKNSTFA